MNTQNNLSIKKLTEAIELNPTNANAHNNRGHAYHTKGNYDKAIADYTKAIQLNPQLAEAYSNRGAAHSRKGVYHRAIQDLNRAIQLNPKLSDAYNNRGAAYGREGEYDKAIADFNKAIQLDPYFTVAYNNRGVAYKSKGEHDRATADFAKEKELQNRNIKKERFDNLFSQLRNLAPSIDQSALNTCESTYNQLIKLHQTLDLSEQTLQEINGYRQKFLDERQKLIFFNLSTQVMNPNVETRYPLPKLDDRDLQLAGEWCRPSRYNLNRTSLIAARSKKERELDRLLSARSAEKVAANFYSFYGKTVEDISISQIEKNRKSEWEKADLYVDDLYVDGLYVDVKNSRQSQKSPDRYTEHYIQKKFKHNAEYQNVTIAGVFSPNLRTYELLGEPESYHEYREIQFLGETTWKKLQELKREFKDSVDFEEPNPTGNFFLPPWVFDYPDYVYTQRDKARKELKNFPNLDSLKSAPIEFNLIPVSIAVDIDLTEILGDKISEEWELLFLDQLRKRIEKHGLSLPFLFLTILTHFLNMAHSPKTSSDFKPDRYREFLFYKGSDTPLGIYDPLKTIGALINNLITLWTAGSIRQFRQFKLRSFNILWGKSNPNENRWTTLIAYCRECGKNPLVLGEAKICKRRSLICPEPDCGFCCPTCRGEDQAAALENA